MSAATNVGGTVYFKAGGKTLSAEGSITVDLSAFEREEKVGMDGEVHFTETPVAPFVEGTFYLNKSADPNEIAAMVDVTVKVELGSGRTGTLRNAFNTGRLPIDTAAGTFNGKWIGKQGVWDPPPA